jgi:hypothetical protein
VLVELSVVLEPVPRVAVIATSVVTFPVEATVVVVSNVQPVFTSVTLTVNVPADKPVNVPEVPLAGFVGFDGDGSITSKEKGPALPLGVTVNEPLPAQNEPVLFEKVTLMLERTVTTAVHENVLFAESV